MILGVILVFGFVFVFADYPPFGREMREQEFLFAKDFIQLNHGSFGSPPREVIAARRIYEDECESNPDKFIRGGYQKYLVENRERLATYLNSDPKDIVFIENASSGINAILRSLRLKPTDVVIELSTAYGMVKNTLDWLSDFEGIKVVEVDVVFPGKGQPPTGLYGSILDDIEDAILEHSGNVKLVSVSHIASVPALIFPVEEIAELCKRHGVLVLIDGAHALGQIPVDLTSLEASGVDYWLGNGHKWLYSPKGSAILWVTKSKQSSVIPTVISSSFTTGVVPEGSEYLNRFQYTGTRDYTPYCAMGAAMDFRDAVGEERIMTYNHELAIWAQEYLSVLWNTEVLLPDSMTAMMSHPRLPSKIRNVEQLSWLKNTLMDEYNIESTLFSLTNKKTMETSFWVRLSAQIYLEQSDIDRFGHAHV